MLQWTLRDGQTVELLAGGRSLGHIGLKRGSHGRAELALQLDQAVRVSPAHVCVSELKRTEQIAEPLRPATCLRDLLLAERNRRRGAVGVAE